MDQIILKKTNNIFVNAGIVGLYRTLQDFLLRDQRFSPDISKLDDDGFTISCEELPALLVEVYYFMGRRWYDTTTNKQLEEAKNEKANFYYDEKEDKFHAFPKISALGLPHLLTNNAQGTTRFEENSSTIAKLRKEQPELATKFETHFKEKGVKLLSKVYFNEPYTKITRLIFKKDYLQPGNKICPILNEGFKTLVNGINVSPFIKGMGNFNSHFGGDSKLSWKALYLIRFSPVLCLFSYQDQYKSLVCNFWNTKSLIDLNRINSKESTRLIEDLRKEGFRTNIQFPLLSYPTKTQEITVDPARDNCGSAEQTFMLLYTFYKRQFEDSLEESSQDFADLLGEFNEIPISLVSFRSDEFASTFRASQYQEFNQVKAVLKLIHELEKEGSDSSVKDIWQGLKIKNPKAGTKGQFKGERAIRGKVFAKFLKGKSILKELESLYYKAFNLIISNEKPGFRRYKSLLQFLIIFEQKINFGNNHAMDATLQETTIKLGTRIGMDILKFEPNDVKGSIKSSRKYIIRLRKASTLKKFLDAFIALQTKYQLKFISMKDFVGKINEDNFYQIKQYLLISILNQLNTNSFKSNSNETK